MKKKVIASLFLAGSLFITSNAVFAGSYEENDKYNGYYYTIKDTCNSSGYSAMSKWESPTGTVKVSVQTYLYAAGGVQPGEFKESDPEIGQSTVSDITSNKYQLARIECKHYANDVIIRQMSLYP